LTTYLLAAACFPQYLRLIVQKILNFLPNTLHIKSRKISARIKFCQPTILLSLHRDKARFMYHSIQWSIGFGFVWDAEKWRRTLRWVTSTHWNCSTINGRSLLYWNQNNRNVLFTSKKDSPNHLATIWIRWRDFCLRLVPRHRKHWKCNKHKFFAWMVSKQKIFILHCLKI
jgi:hypothetical protein